MSVATTPAAADAATPVPPPVSETCPLCGAPLHPEQEWCLRCGAAARTRLAASPNWRATVFTLAAVAALSLGVLAAALVKLAGDSTATTTPAATTIVTTAPAATIPSSTTPVPGATTPSTTLSTPTTTTSTTPGATTTPGLATPGSVTTGATTTPSTTTKAPKR